MLGRPTRIIQSCQRRSRITNCTSSQKGIPKGAAACERRPLWRASLVTFLHEQESDIPPLFARRRKFPATRSVAKACASSSPARRRRRQPQAPPRAAWPPTAGGIRNASKGCFFSCKKHPSCRCAAIHPPKIRFHGKGVPRFAKRGQRRCLWNPQPLQRLANPPPQAATPKIRFYGKGVPLAAASGQRRCLWNPQPLKRLAKLLLQPAAAGGKPLR